jgi:hypothetical protein
LKGKVKGEYLLTLAYDSDKDKNQRLFRDIRPDEYYPVYGILLLKALMLNRPVNCMCVLIKVVHMPCMVIMLPVLKMMKDLSLGQYNRSLTGVRGAVETDKYKVTAFAANTNTQQVVNEQRAMGISGPYGLGSVNAQDIRDNSEKVK